MKKLVAFFLTAVAASWLATGARAQQAPRREQPLRAVVSFDGKLEAFPKLTPEDFEIEAGKQKLPASRLYGPGDLPTVLAVVLQENQTPSFGMQLPALRDFILHLPANTYVGVFYLNQQAVDIAIVFDSNLEKVAAAVRAPKGVQDAAPLSPYNSLTNIITYMASLPDARKEVLLFTEGSDALAGGTTPGKNQDLAGAVTAAQQTGIPVWVIFSETLPPPSRLASNTRRASGPVPGGPRGPSQAPSSDSPGGGTSAGSQASGGQESSLGAGGIDPFASSSAPLVQDNLSYLNYLAEHVGGKVFSPGKFPSDIRPFLEEFQRLLAQQYVVEFQGNEPARKIKLNRKIGGAKVLAPKR